jgi:hypothetical protein
MFTFYDLNKLSKTSNENLIELIDINNNYTFVNNLIQNTYNNSLNLTLNESYNNIFILYHNLNKEDLRIVSHYSINSLKSLNVLKYIFN